jgi:hypothetical protein
VGLVTNPVGHPRDLTISAARPRRWPVGGHNAERAAGDPGCWATTWIWSWGHPGKGKTHLLAVSIVFIVETARRAGRPLRILLTAFTNAAIDNLLAAFLFRATSRRGQSGCQSLRSQRCEQSGRHLSSQPTRPSTRYEQVAASGWIFNQAIMRSGDAAQLASLAWRADQLTVRLEATAIRPREPVDR